MKVKFKCPHCEQKISASADVIGTTVSCPGCNGTFQALAESVILTPPPLPSTKKHKIPSGVAAVIISVIGWLVRVFVTMKVAASQGNFEEAFQWNFLGVMIIAVGGALGFLAIARKDGRLGGFIAVLLMLLYVADRWYSLQRAE